MSKEVVVIVNNTTIYCGTLGCRFNESCGECALRNVSIMEGKCIRYEPWPENPKA